MIRLYTDHDKFSDEPPSAVLEAFYGAAREVIRRKFENSGLAREDFVFGNGHEVMSHDPRRAFA
jgi:hypothetical protein